MYSLLFPPPDIMVKITPFHTHTQIFMSWSQTKKNYKKKNLKHRVFIKIYCILLGRRDCMAAKRKRKEQMR